MQREFAKLNTDHSVYTVGTLPALTGPESGLLPTAEHRLQFPSMSEPTPVHLSSVSRELLVVLK